MKTKPSQVGQRGSKAALAAQSKTSNARAGAKRFDPKEYKLVSLRECPWLDGRPLLETPEQAADYWRQHVATEARFDSGRESMVVLLLNTRCRLIGHVGLAQGTKNTLLENHAETLRPAVIAGASGIVLMHNHPSGNPTPSDSDLKVTRELRRAGALMNVEVVDHVIMGKPTRDSEKDYLSLKEMGYFGERLEPELSKAAEGGRRVKRIRQRRAQSGRARRGQLAKEGWLPAELSGIANPEAGRPVGGDSSVLRFADGFGFYLFDKRRECTLNGKPGSEFELARLAIDAVRDPMASGTFKATLTFGPQRTMVKRLTRREAVEWSVRAFLPECFQGDVVVKAKKGELRP